MKAVCLVTEYLSPPYDEGIIKTVYNLFLKLDKRYDLSVICRSGFKKENISVVKANRLFLSREVGRKIKNINPDIIIYFPFVSTTFASYLRLFILGRYNKRSKVFLLALQPKPVKKWQTRIISLINPDFALSPSPELKDFWDSINISSALLPLPTDLEVFKPLDSKGDKSMLRRKYGLNEDMFIITHIGHLNEGRNLKSLFSLQGSENQVLVVGSSSTPRDSLGPATLKEDLVKKGIIIFDGYIKNIEEIYQLSDIYIFPVLSANSSIGLPLSVLEARACGIPVISTDYGSLRYFLGDDNGAILYSSPEDFDISLKNFKVSRLKEYNKTGVKSLNEDFFSTITKTIDLAD